MAGAGFRPNQQQWPSVGAPPTYSAVSSAARPHPPSVHHHHPPPLVLVDNHNSPPSEEIRTVFILGLPDDVKERELSNLLRWFPGYEASKVNFKGNKPMGFALFSTAQFAMKAKDSLQHLVFDIADSKSVIHAEMAKRNLFRKRGRVGDSNSYDQSKLLRTGGDCTHSVYTPSPFHPPPPPVWGPPSHGYVAPAPSPYDPFTDYHAPSVPMPAPKPASAPYDPFTDYHDPFTDYHDPSVPMPAPAPIAGPSSYVPVQNIKDSPPCNTLLIGNLGETINQEELRSLLSSQPGFKQMKILRQERHIVCFTEFEDVNSATNVHHNLQGAVIPSVGSFGLRIQYSKYPFGKRKEGALTYQ